MFSFSTQLQLRTCETLGRGEWSPPFVENLIRDVSPQDSHTAFSLCHSRITFLLCVWSMRAINLESVCVLVSPCVCVSHWLPFILLDGVSYKIFKKSDCLLIFFLFFFYDFPEDIKDFENQVNKSDQLLNLTIFRDLILLKINLGVHRIKPMRGLQLITMMTKCTNRGLNYDIFCYIMCTNKKSKWHSNHFFFGIWYDIWNEPVSFSYSSLY